MTKTGHHEQVAGELLSVTMSVKLKKLAVEQSVLQFDIIIYLGDVLTVARKSKEEFKALLKTKDWRDAYDEFSNTLYDTTDSEQSSDEEE